MKLKIKKESLVEGLRIVQGAVKSATTLPVITNVLLEAEKDSLRLTCTDLDLTITCAVGCKVKAKGATTVSARKLFGVVGEMSGEIEVESDDKNVLAVRSGASFYRLNGIAATEFPETFKKRDVKAVKMAQSDLKTLLQRTAFAMSTDVARYVLCGVFVNVDGDQFAAVGADGRGLALASCEIKNAEARQFITPAAAVSELLRLLTSGEVAVRAEENSVSFEMTSPTEVDGYVPVTVFTKLIEGNFPDYRNVIPKEHRERIAINRVELLGALKRSEMMTSEKSASVKLEFGKNKLSIRANSPEVGDAEEEIALKYNGAEISIAFNPKYLIEPLAALTDDEVFLELTDGLSPGVLKIDGPWLCAISPMRLS